MKLKLENCRMLLAGRRVADGDLEIEDGRIARIVERPCVPQSLVMPGLVNCHGHTAMTLVRGLGSGLPLRRWLEEAIFPVEAKMTAEDVRAGAVWGAMEMLAGGTTCVADMYDFPAAGEAAFAECGIKANTCWVGLAFPGGEPQGRLAECVDYVRQGAANRRTMRDFCIHSEYLTDEKFCRELAAANRDWRRPVHFHVSETRQEHEECLARYGRTPVAYLASTGLLDYGGYAAHGVWCSDDDWRILAEKGVTLVHNPTSNLKLGSGIAPILRARELGVNVALGTDGCASNDNLNLFEEMHLAALLPKGLNCDPAAISAWEVIEMATVNGARALGRPDSGEIAVGKAADLCVIDLHRLHLTPCLDAANLVVSSVQASDVTMTLVDGEIVYDRGQFLRLNQERAEYDFKVAVRRLMR